MSTTPTTIPSTGGGEAEIDANCKVAYRDRPDLGEWFVFLVTDGKAWIERQQGDSEGPVVPIEKLIVTERWA